MAHSYTCNSRNTLTDALMLKYPAFTEVQLARLQPMTLGFYACMFTIAFITIFYSSKTCSSLFMCKGMITYFRRNIYLFIFFVYMEWWISLREKNQQLKKTQCMYKNLLHILMKYTRACMCYNFILSVAVIFSESS